MKKSIYCFYMMNGLTIFAEHDKTLDKAVDGIHRTDYVVKGAVMVKINPENPNEIGMQSAFPFSNQDESVSLNISNVTAHTSLMWNSGLCTQYANFWVQMAARAKTAADQKASGIEVVPANAVIPGIKQGLGIRPPGNRNRRQGPPVRSG